MVFLDKKTPRLTLKDGHFYRLHRSIFKGRVVNKDKKSMEMPGIEPGTSRMRSERSTPELHPQ